MQKSTRIIMWGLSSIFVIGLIAAGVIVLMFSDNAQNLFSSEAAGNDSDETSQGDTDSKELDSLKASEEEFEVSDEATSTGIPSEKMFADSIHHMTHQKVEAAQKWGHLEITDERLKQKYETAKTSDYEYRAFYMETLKAWMNGDFSNAVEVHNVIWNERNGSVGQATGLMSPKEEMEYKNAHFE
ncbi:hypothetical protein J4760_00395 [Salinicoccus sp. ID82-1]|uniref:Uncharacterized protein n=1 Tax=Salinicoccus cyprini TaxID=2493691 RepID=A0A558AXJ8_9STAP|nr:MULTISPECIES: DUF6241 domain-containing protein [Salinicoccus]MCG1008500.1 hypothetical protein [Salinicoccus sp. ID82-1]TVT28984.1 hypothetical protein FO441_01525 [Salinicoccus cyprini]